MEKLKSRKEGLDSGWDGMGLGIINRVALKPDKESVSQFSRSVVSDSATP